MRLKNNGYSKAKQEKYHNDHGCYEKIESEYRKAPRCGYEGSDNYNNIIIFTGKRGTGKTSAMSSFGEYLEKYGINLSKDKCNDNSKEDQISFKRLQLIDPSHFNENKNILITIISSMFKMAKCIQEENKYDREGRQSFDKNVFNELLRQFEKVFKLIGRLDFQNKDDNTLEYLNDLSETSGLKKAVHELIDRFLRFLPCKPDYLLVMIDDLDMNVSYAAVMLEQIRKFLMLDNILILMAANMNQLQNEMKEYYSVFFRNTLNTDNQTLSIDVEDLATKYLLKIFPASRRIHVENAVNRFLNTKISIEDELNQDDYQKYNGRDLQKFVLTMIWERTRLLFIPPEGNLHPIIPTNLRDLHQFVYMLLDMKPLDDKINDGNNTDDKKINKLFINKAEFNKCKENFNKFKNYILHNWIPSNVSLEEETVFNNIPKDIMEINKHLINSINVIGTQNKKRLMAKEVDLKQIEQNAKIKIDRDIYTMVSPNDPKFVKANKISDIFNHPSNYSYGDILLLIDKYETYFESVEDNRFIDAVKIYYSMLLFETMFFESKVPYDYKEETQNGKKNPQNDAKCISSLDFFSDPKNIIPIQKLLGGTVYYPNYFEIIPSKEFKQKEFYDAKRPFYHKYKIEPAKDEKMDENVSKNINKLFFILYYGEIRPERYFTEHIYDTTYELHSDVDGIKYVVFDMLSLFNNMLNPLHTLARTNRDIDDDLMNKFENWKRICTCDDKEEVYYPNTLLPFYSVDMMLIYLRKQQNFEDLIKETSYNFDFTKDIINKISEELREQVFQTKELDLLSIINGEKVNTNVKHIIYPIIDDDTIDKLAGNHFIIQEALKLQNNTIPSNDEIELYRLIANIVYVTNIKFEFKEITEYVVNQTAGNEVKEENTGKHYQLFSDNQRYIVEFDKTAEKFILERKNYQIKDKFDSIELVNRYLINRYLKGKRLNSKEKIIKIDNNFLIIDNYDDYKFTFDSNKYKCDYLGNTIILDEPSNDDSILSQSKKSDGKEYYIAGITNVIINKGNNENLRFYYHNGQFETCNYEEVKEITFKDIANIMKKPLNILCDDKTLDVTEKDNELEIEYNHKKYKLFIQNQTIILKRTSPDNISEWEGQFVLNVSKGGDIKEGNFTCQSNDSITCTDIEKTSFNYLSKLPLSGKIDLFKNRVITLLLAFYKGRPDDIDKMIEKINDIKTIPEIMKFLVMELWNNEIKDSIIRRAIQKEIRTPEFIEKYYGKLKDLTEKAINRIDLECENNKSKDNNREASTEEVSTENVYDVNFTATITAKEKNHYEGDGTISYKAKTIGNKAKNSDDNNSKKGSIWNIYDSIYKVGVETFIRENKNSNNKQSENTSQESSTQEK